MVIGLLIARRKGSKMFFYFWKPPRRFSFFQSLLCFFQSFGHKMSVRKFHVGSRFLLPAFPFFERGDMRQVMVAVPGIKADVFGYANISFLIGMEESPLKFLLR